MVSSRGLGDVYKRQASDFASGKVTASQQGGFSNPEFMRFLERVVGYVADIASATATTAAATTDTAAATNATADAVIGGGLATTVGVQTADSSAMTGFNSGRV